MAAPGKKSGQSKTSKAPPDMQSMVEALLKMAAQAPAYTLADAATEAKLYEMVVLAKVLEAYPDVVEVKTPGNASVFKLAGNPSKATKSKFTYFNLKSGGRVVHEVWVSVEVKTLSWSSAGATGTALASQHEIDVAVFAPLAADSYPTHNQLHAGLSCKHMNASKAHVRELLGLRRETALLNLHQASLAPWLEGPSLNAEPASPLFLVSSDAGVVDYATPIGMFGAYVRYIPFP